MSKSETKKDMWGNEYTQHYDDSGNKTGWSENRNDAWGNSYEQHYDQSGDKTGWTESKSDSWGSDYSQHYDSDGEKSGWSGSESDAWGNDFDQHYDNESTKTGWSESKRDSWGNNYEQGYNQDGSKSGSRLHHGTQTRSRHGVDAERSGYSSSYSGGSYEGSTGGDSSSAGFWIGGGLVLLLLFSVIPGVGGSRRVQTPQGSTTSNSYISPSPRSEPYSPPYSARPSFECVGSLTWEQRAICSDESLAVQDREVARLSEQLLASEYADEVRRINATWREEWDRCGGSGSIPGCLSWVYREWLKQLRSREASSRATEAATDGQTETTVRNDAGVTLADTMMSLKQQLRAVERRIQEALPSQDQTDFGLARASWEVDNIMLRCVSRPECAVPLYRERIAELSAIRSPHFRRSDGRIVESR